MTDQIANENEIKPGDYCRVYIDAKANFPAQSPGVYLNPSMFELNRPGELIQLDNGPSAADVFGHPGGPNSTTTPTPAPDFLNGPTPPAGGPTPPATEPNRLVDGKVYTAEQLRGFKWTEAQIAALPVAP